MNSEEKLIIELEKLNRRLDILTNPLKNSWYNFYSGIFRSLGSLFGTFVVAACLVYLIRQIDIVKPITSWTENVLQQIRWERVIPTATPSQP